MRCRSNPNLNPSPTEPEALLVALEVPGAALLELLLLLLPQPASAISDRVATRAIATRNRDTTLMVVTTSLLSLNV